MVRVRSMIGWTAAAMLALTTVAHAGAGVPLTPGADGHATVPVFVDCKGPYPFILDTGADGSAVYAWFACQARLAPAPGGDQLLTGQTGSEKVRMYEIGRATLDGHAIAHVAAFELPDRRDRGEQAGVLGNDFMDGTLVAFNFPCRRVQLYPRVDAVRIAGAGASSVAAGSVARQHRADPAGDHQRLHRHRGTGYGFAAESDDPWLRAGGRHLWRAHATETGRRSSVSGSVHLRR